MKTKSIQKTGAVYGGKAILAASKQMRAIVHSVCRKVNRLER